MRYSTLVSGVRLTTVVVLAASARSFAASDVIFVDHAASGANTGESWDNAFFDLQDALDVAEPGAQVWVRRGTYRPDRETNDPTRSFAVPESVAVYGSFLGTETDLSQRTVDPASTVLSGFLDGNQSHHVVRIENNASESVLDGFTVTGGLPDSESGGGVRVVSAEATLSNLIVRDNASGRSPHFVFPPGPLAVGGGGVYCGLGAVVRIESSMFASNIARTGLRGLSKDGHIGFGGSGGRGGAVYFRNGSSGIIRDCSFVANETGWGG